MSVDSTPPQIINFESNPSVFNPALTEALLSAELSDPTPPIAWDLIIRSSSGVEVRRFSGSGSTVSQSWDGRDAEELPVSDGEYTAELRASDGLGHARSASLEIVVDSLSPTVVNWVPADMGNTIWTRPPLRVTLSDPGSGIDPSTVQIELDGTALDTTYDGSGNASAQPSSPLSLDTDHVTRVSASDYAGNSMVQQVTFRVMRVIQELMQVSIPAVQAVIPAACSGCSLTFTGINIIEGNHDVTLSSTANSGSGTLRRTVNLNAEAIWSTPLGQRSAPVTLGQFISQDEISVDDAFPTAVDLIFQERPEALPSVTIPVPPDAIPGSVATLRMSATNAPPACTDTSIAPDPGVCGGPMFPSVAQDPIPSAALESPLRADPTGAFLPDTPTVPGPDDFEYPVLPAAPDDPTPPATPPLPSGSPIAVYEPGVLALRIKPNNNINTVVQSHGGSSNQIQPELSTTSFTNGHREAGMDRHFQVQVPIGSELVKLQEYNLDNRIEYVQLIPNQPLSNMVNDPRRSEQHHLEENNGVAIHVAWDYSEFMWPGGRPLDGFFGLHEVRQAVIDTGIRGTHEDLNGKVSSGWNVYNSTPILDNANSETGCQGPAHGTAVAGLNTMTDNGRGLAGVNFRGKLVPIVIWRGPANDCRDIPSGKYDDATEEAWRRADVVNQSSGYENYYEAHCNEIAAAWYNGAIHINAGAETPRGVNARYPGGCWASLSVAMTDRDTGHVHADSLPSVSNDELAAPGEHLSTVDGTENNTAYQAVSGTSFAAPIASGVAQLLMSHGVDNHDTYSALVHSATPIAGCPAPCVGRVNAARAIRSALKNGTMEGWWNQPSGPPRPRYGSLGWQEYDSCQDPDPDSYTILKSEIDQVFHGGQYNLGLRCLDNRSQTAGEVKLFQRVAVNPGYPYRFDADVVKNSNGPSGSLVSVRICYYDLNNARKGCTREVTGENIGTTWSSWDFSVVAPEGALTAEIILRVREGGTGTGFVYWDNVGFFNYRVNS